MIREKLISRLGDSRQYRSGITHGDVCELTLSVELIEELRQALQSKRENDVSMGLFFLEALANSPDHNIDKLEPDLIGILPGLVKTSNSNIKVSAVKFLIAYRVHFEKFREIMLSALNDDSPVVRALALRAYTLYASPREYEPLEIFESDSYSGEIGMGSHLVYELRNLALEVLGKIAGQDFKQNEETEIHESGNAIFWWSWQPYHKWKKSWRRRFSRS
jgi:hypothetical protein